MRNKITGSPKPLLISFLLPLCFSHQPPERGALERVVAAGVGTRKTGLRGAAGGRAHGGLSHVTARPLTGVCVQRRSHAASSSCPAVARGGVFVFLTGVFNGGKQHLGLPRTM
jgi:hypothetical protein